MADPGSPAQTERWILEQWALKLSQAIGAMMGDAPKVLTGAAYEQASPASAVLWWAQLLSDSPGVEFRVGAPEEAWRTIGNEVLKSAGIDDADDGNIKSTYQEILNQSLSGLAQALSGRLRREIVCSGGGETATEPPDRVACQLALGGAPIVLYSAATRALVELVETPTPTAPPPVAASSPPAESTAGKSYPKGLDLLLDVELPVSISFGRAELAIKDVIKLTTGSIVELNRSINEPVEVIVNNVVIARGEVVVVEGNFGVRIKEVISRQERLRTLR